MHPARPAAAILAGGLARRFGGADKCRLVVDGRPIIVRELDVLQRVAAECFVVTRAGDAGRFADLGVPVHEDRVPDAGVLGGVYTALDAATADPVIVVGCDLPFLHAGVLQRLVELSEGADGAWVRTAAGIEPLVACYRRAARGAIRDAIARGDLQAAGLGRRLRLAELGEAEIARFGPVGRLLANVNTADDYARVQWRGAPDAR